MKRLASIPCSAAAASLPNRRPEQQPGMVERGRVVLDQPQDVPFLQGAGMAPGAAGGLRHTRAPFSERALSAFSVLELMVAVSLLALIVTALLAMFNQTQKAFRGGMAQTDVMESGRIVMQFLTREMQQIAATRSAEATNLLVWTPDSRTPESSMMDLPGGQVRPNRLQDITFFRRVNDEWIATAYRLSDAGTGVGALYRWEAQFPTNYTDLRMLSGDANQPIANPANTQGFNFIADGIVHLAAYAFDTNGIAIPFGTNSIPFKPTPADPFRGYVFRNDELPAFIDLELGILEPRTIDQYKAKVAANTPKVKLDEWLSQQANRMHLFVQRIPIRTAP